MAKKVLSIGRIVLYRLTERDAEAINRRRTDSASIAVRVTRTTLESPGPTWPLGAQAHIGNSVSEGDTFPMLITRVSADEANGQVFLDGNDVLWISDVTVGKGPGTFS